MHCRVYLLTVYMEVWGFPDAVSALWIAHMGSQRFSKTCEVLGFGARVTTPKNGKMGFP
jgi:hypothetical protein